MRKATVQKILCWLISFAAVFLFIGSLNCGCAFAAPVNSAVPINSGQTMGPADCHGHDTTPSRHDAAGETCCAGCRVGKTYTPPSLEMPVPPQKNFFSHILHTTFQPQGAAISFSGPQNNFKQRTAFCTKNNIRGVSTTGSPIYIFVQSLLI